jgi:DNA-binding response OmpR family regulator
MTSALSAAARHLRIVDESGPEEPGTAREAHARDAAAREGTDVTDLYTADGTRARFRPLPPAERPPAGGPSPDAAPDGTDGVHVDPERHTAHVDGRRLDLTYLEFELLAHFVANPHRVHSRAHLVGALWGYSHVGDGRTVDVHIARLRRKLGPFRDTIVTVRRVGYKYEPGRAR